MNLAFKSISTFLLLSLFTLPTLAQERPAGGAGNRPGFNADKWNFLVAVGPFFAPEFEGATHYRFLPIPFLRASKGNYYIQTEGPGLTANVINSRNIKAGPSIQFRGERDSDVRNTLVKRLQTINSSIELGGFLSYSIPLDNPGEQIEAKIKTMFDAGNAHNGYTVATSLSYSRIIERRIRLGLSLSSTYADSNYNNTYFGVSAIDAIRGAIPTYATSSGIKDIGAAINLGYSIDRNWGVVALFGYKKLLNPAKNSPIIISAGTTNQFIGNIGVSYRF